MKETTINFGAFDSELIAQEWAIPEGYTAKVEDGKVIVFIPSKEEDEDRITCGNALLSMGY